MKNYCTKPNGLIVLCKHGGNKVYNYGFMLGMTGYCQLAKKYIHEMKACPKESDGAK